MSWVTVVWSMIASACLTLALVHGLVWWWRREARANVLFALTAVATTFLAAGEVWMMRAGTPEQFATAVRWTHVPAWALIVSLVGFVRLYLRAGRRWLAWAVCGLRTLSLILNFLTGANLNYREITAVRRIPFLGESVFVAEGVPNPWMLVGQLSLLLLVIFVADAALTVWRRGDRRQALVVGGGIVFLALMGTGQAMLVFWGIIPAPITASLFYMGIVAAMGFELSHDVLRAAELSEELRESEQRMDLAASAADLGLWVWDIARDEIWTTDKGRELFGFAKAEPLDFARFAGRLHPDDREPVRAAVAAALPNGGDYHAEYRVVSGDAPPRWIAARGKTEFSADGKPLRMRGVSIDITERKRSEEALRESEARFRTVANTAPVMIWMAGTDTLCNFFNKRWLDFTGRTLEQELGNGWAEGVHPDDFERCFKTYTTSFGARQEFTMQYRLRKGDGEYGWVLDTGVPRIAADGAFLGYIGSAIDITMQKQAEERFRLVVEASPNAMVMVNSEGSITLVNAQAETVFGYTRTELIGQSIEVLVPERYRTRHPSHRHVYFADPTTRAMGAGRELFGRRKDGSEVPVEIGLNPIRTPEGLFVLASIVDITERKHAELEAVRQRSELTHLSRVAMLGELSSSLAHELNQPLTAILSNAQAAQRFLARPQINRAELEEILSDIVDADQHAGEVIRSLRLLLKKGEVQRQPLGANEVVQEALNLMRSDLLNHQVAAETELAPDLPTVRGDRVQLQQVLLNLVMNACDAMAGSDGTGRRLCVSTRRIAGEGVRVSVRDHGRGIPADSLGRVFEPFFTTKPQGLGLGLAVCRSILLAHGGGLSAENHPGGGAVFHFTLPTDIPAKT